MPIEVEEFRYKKFYKETLSSQVEAEAYAQENGFPGYKLVNCLALLGGRRASDGSNIIAKYKRMEMN